MSRIFAYCRVSTTEQTTDNQVIAIRGAGYDVLPSRVITDTVSGSVEAMKRKGFKELIEHKLEAGDALVVLKLDRLGRDNVDVQQTVSKLSSLKIKLVCLDLPVSDLSSSEGKLMLQMFSAFAEFERNRIRERTQEGLVRAKMEGKVLGRPPAKRTRELVQGARAEGLSQTQAVKKLNFSLSTIKRNWNK